MADKVGFRNNALAELAQVLQAADTELFMSTEHGDRFTPPDGTDYIVATLGDPDAEHEIVHLSAVAFVGDGLARFQVVRNREGTHRSEPWPAGTRVQGLLTAGGLNAMRGGPVVGFETDATGSLRAGAAATAAGVVLGDNGAHIALMPGGSRRYAVEYRPDESVPAGAIIYAGGYSFMALNEGPLGQEPPSLEASPQRSGQVFYAPVGRTDAPKLENHSITLGSEALPGGEGAVVIGAMATVAELASDGMALGQGAASLQVEALAVGGWAMAAGVRAVAIGGGALAMADASIAIGTKVEIAHSWRIAGVPTLGEGIAGVDPLSDFQAVAIAPDATVALAHTDIGVVRTWQPLMTVRSGDVVMPTVAGDYAYVAEAPFFAQVADNTVQTGSEDTDAGRPIAAQATSPVSQHKSSLIKGLAMVYVSTPREQVQGLDVLVELPSGQCYAYPLQMQSHGVARAQPGRGIRESYLGFGVRNVAGADFEIERIEVQTHASATRRV